MRSYTPKPIDRRTPIDSAVMALACLNAEDMGEAVASFNALFDRCPSKPKLAVVNATPRPAGPHPTKDHPHA